MLITDQQSGDTFSTQVAAVTADNIGIIGVSSVDNSALTVSTVTICEDHTSVIASIFLRIFIQIK